MEQVQPSQESYKIICRNLPEELIFDKNKAKLYFKQFGKVKRVAFKPKGHICTVEYTNKTDLLKALNNAGNYNDQQFSVAIDNSVSPPKKKIVKKHSISYIDPDEVHQELIALGGLPSYSKIASEKTSSGALPKDSAKLKLKRVWKKEAPVAAQVTKKDTKSAVAQKSKVQSISPEKQELLKIMQQPAVTIDEKYRVLDARDKLIRLCMKKSAQLKSSPTVGTCPDMCPEKERIMRELQHQVAYYEQDERDRNILNAKTAVKQYSRSSADQEAPLPHELRPVKVLQMTMGYLMHSIMDLCEMEDVNLAEWYHFLWDRTRGIRKDITQQNLCCQGSVELVEQCARFHIHCSARLVAEEPSVFDQKINTENLTKCLQSLKYMYDDLRLKGESCPNEAEFRAYIILLNMSDGNFMWEVQQLRPEIQKSPEVKFALQIYSAFDKRNYVKFFKLIKSTTYLNACILMRYFVQVRVTAVTTLSKCFTPPKMTTFYPISEIKEILDFDDLDSAIEFLQTYGVNVNDKKTHFIFQRSSFTLPEFPYILDRSMNVERKRVLSVGRTVCGKDLPEPLYLNHEPQNSFDRSGKLVSHVEFSESEVNVDESDAVDLNEDNTSDMKSNIFLQPKETNKSEFVFGKASPIKAVVDQPISSNIFAKRPSDNTSNIFGNKAPAVPPQDQVDSCATLPNIFARPLSPKHSSPVLFGAVAGSNKSIFSAKPDNSATNSMTIFGKTESFQQNIFEKSSSQVEKTVPIAEKSFNIFGKSSDKPMPNVFSKTPPKQGGFTFALPKTKTEKRLELENTVFEVAGNELVSFSQNSKNDTAKLSEEIARENERRKQEEERRKQEEERRKQDKKELKLLEEERSRLQRELQKEIELEEQREREKQRVEQLKKEEMKRLQEERLKREQERKRLEQLEKEERERRLKQLIQEQKEAERKRTLKIQEDVKVLVEELLVQVEHKIRSEILSNIRSSIQRRKLRQICRKWRSIVTRKIKKRKAIDCGPVWVNPKNLRECARDFHANSQEYTLQFMKRYKLGKPLEIQFEDEKIAQKIDIFKLTYSTLKQRLFEIKEKCQKNIYWKVSVSIPDTNEMPIGLGKLERNLDEYIQWSNQDGEVRYLEKFCPNKFESVTYCVQKQQGFDVSFSAANGFIFIAKKFDSSLQLRIFENLKDFGVFVKLPIVVILQESLNTSYQYISSLKETGIVSDYRILVAKFSPKSLKEAIDQSLVFLSQNIEKTPPLELDTLYGFLYKYLCTEIWKKMNSYAKKDPQFCECMRDPNVVISLYNDCMKRLSKIVFDEDIQEHATFPEEFKKYLPSEFPDYFPCNYRYFPHYYKDSEYIAKIKGLLRNLELPSYKETWPPETEEELFMGLSKYCSRVFENAQETFITLYNLLLNEEQDEEILWTDAIEVLTKHKLKEQDLSLIGTKFENSIYKTFTVVYNADTLKKFNEDHWFYFNNSVIENFTKKLVVEEPKESKKRSIEMVDLRLDFEDVIARAEKVLKSPHDSSVSTKKEIEDISKGMEDLENSIRIMKKINYVVQKLAD